MTEALKAAILETLSEVAPEIDIAAVDPRDTSIKGTRVIEWGPGSAIIKKSMLVGI